MSAVPRRIVWRCRRGTKELDLALTDFLEQGYAALDVDEQRLFEEMLECQDTSLIEWLLYEKPADPRFAAVVAKILRYREDDKP